MGASVQSPEIQAFAVGFPLTLLHAAVTLLILLAAAGLYILLTPNREVALVRQGNQAAAVSAAAVLVGLAIPLAASLKASDTLAEVGLWGVSAVLVQLLAFRLTDIVLRGLAARIEAGDVGAAVALGAAKLATALIVAAAVSG